ncbi:hypothetical protein [Haloglomus halophilum]|uniref:hypothetical protein n=1 Tax=Haloglomus halophilum TaxID=2962672 RepID=UPI0020C9D62B|nr:hypothetical protein [Haloglomus halophilum]
MQEPSKPRTDRPEAPAPGVTRRTALAGVGMLAVTSLSGCLGLLGAEPVNADVPNTPASTTTRQPTTPGTDAPTMPVKAGNENGDGTGDDDSTTPDATDDPVTAAGLPTGPAVLSSDIEPALPFTRSGDRYRTHDRVYVGPISSPATNEWMRYRRDPAPGAKLADVTVTNSTPDEWIISHPYSGVHENTLGLSANADGTFTLEGNLFFQNEGAYYGINHLSVQEHTAELVLTYGHNPMWTEAELEAGYGYWYGPLTVTGRFDGDIAQLRITLLSGEQAFEGTPDNTLMFNLIPTS